MIRFIFCLFFLAVSACASFASQDVIDLGETGFSCPLELTVVNKDHAMRSILDGVSGNKNSRPINLFFKSNLPRHSGPPETKHVSFKKNLSIPIGTKIFVFSCFDEASTELAPTLGFDYGLCIDYNSLNDIEDFRNKTGISEPVQAANDEIIKTFGVTSYPALITVKEDEFQIQEGF